MNAQRPRILFSSPPPHLHGGVAVCAPVLENELRKLLDLQTFKYGREEDDEPLFLKAFDRSKDLFKLRSKIITFRPWIIHHNTAFDKLAIIRDAPLIWLARFHKVPALLVMHGSLISSFTAMNPALERVKSSVLKNATCIGVLSELERERFLETWPFLSEHIKVVKNIIGNEFYSIERREAESPIILFNSRFIRQKGPFDLLEAVPAVIDKFPTARFIFVGSGPQALEFDQQVRTKALNASVRRIDFIDNLATASFYASAWLFVFPTHFPEGMPMVVAQALAAGLPIITTRTNFSHSYMKPFEHCLFIEHQNPRAIAEAVLLLLENNTLRNHMATNNRLLAKNFTAEVVTREFMEIYDGMMTAASGSSLT